MSEILKCDKHYHDRMTNPDNKVKVDFEHIKRKVLTRKQVYHENTGRYSYETEFTSYDPIEKLDKYRVSDFSISTLNALGVKLDSVQLSQSKMHHVENAARQISNIESQVINNPTNN